MANEVCKQCHKSVYYKCERIYGADTPPCAKAVVENCHSLQLLNVTIALWHEALDAHRGQNVDAWFWSNIDRINAVIAQHATI